MDHLEQLNGGTGSGSKTCPGCGAKLQSDRPDAVGYVPAKLIDQPDAVCMRCFRIRHYNEPAQVMSDQDDFLKILDGIGNTDSLVLHIVDLFDFEGSLISALPRFVRGNPIIVAVNKIDLLPDVNPNKIVNWTRRQLKAVGLKVLNVIPISAKSSDGLDRLAEAMEQARAGRDVYVVGATNTGKSTLINRIIRHYSDLTMELTTSRYPGTTLDIVRIPLTDGRALIDTPGIVYSDRLTERVDSSTLKKLLPEQPIRPRVYQLNPEQTIFFGALARFDFVQGERQSFTCYVANPLKLHRTKRVRADAFYLKHKGELLQPPAKEHLSQLEPLSPHTFRIPPGKRMDISVSGLGWIRANSTSGAIVEMHVPKGTKVSLRESLI